MCGIVGYYSVAENVEFNISEINKMMDSIHHRGPDARGFWADEDGHLTLGHVRLSILDLSENGSQPMQSYRQNYVISFNGEIYNFIELKKKLILLNIKFKSSSDTEVLLAAFDTWGIEKTLLQIEGMFAIALWNRREKKLFLIRDRMGEKPLFYGIQDDLFFFSSELSVLKNLKKFNIKVSKKAINTFLHLGYLEKNQTFFENIYSVPRSNFIEINLSTNKKINYENLIIKEYWNPDNSKKYNFTNFQDYSHELDSLLKNKIKDQIITDVPVGAFLSGGIDSSLIVSYMQELSINKVKTFTIGFEQNGFNEAHHAKKIANFLGTEHQELYISDREVQENIKNIVNVYDQPLGDISSVPTKILSDFVRKNVTVSLSGDGADELFCGYNRYKVFDKYYNFKFRKLLAGLLKVIPKKSIESIFSKKDSFAHQYITAARIQKFENMISKDKRSKLNYQILLMNDQSLITKILQHDSSIVDYMDLNSSYSLDDIDDKENAHLIKIMNEDLDHYLPEDILVKVDRAAMSASLETRMPFLNHKIVEFSNSLPFKYKYHDKKNMKFILKDILSKKIPENLYSRPKQGFSVPISMWLKGNLKSWMLDNLSDSSLTSTNVFIKSEINIIIRKFLNDNNSMNVQLIWNIIMIQQWMLSNKLSF